MDIQVVFHPNHLGASEDEDQLDTVLRMVAWGNSSLDARENGMVDKYGIELENNTFLMHPYCWCEKEGECPWCTGCGFYQDNNGLCQACSEPHIHLATCYQTELNEARKAAGLSHTLNGQYVKGPVERGYDERRAIENPIYAELCNKHGLDAHFGAAVHCDCGADMKRQQATRERGCDYVRGLGIFARFQPWEKDSDRHYYDPPHFWYKATNFRVKWYKYIGRETATNRELREGELSRIVADCVPNPTAAWQAVTEAGQKRSEMMADMIQRLNVSM